MVSEEEMTKKADALDELSVLFSRLANVLRANEQGFWSWQQVVAELEEKIDYKLAELNAV